MERTITINTSRWVTQKAYCELTGVKQGNMSKLISRGKLKFRRIEELGLTLVERPLKIKKS